MANPSQYYRPTSLDEARQYLQQPGSIALAGGALAFGGLELPYAHVIDLQDVAELKQIELQNGTLSVGGAVMLQVIVENDDVPDVLKRSITRTLPPNIRNGASVGESLLVPRPPHEWLAALVALDVGIEQVIAGGERVKSSIASIIDDTAETGFADGIITRLEIPLLKEREALGASFVARTPADQPIVNAATFVRLGSDGNVETAFAAVGGASAEPVLNIELSNLTGNPLDEMHIDHTVKPIPSLVDPVADYKGSVEYRREMARVCVRRALVECMALSVKNVAK